MKGIIHYDTTVIPDLDLSGCKYTKHCIKINNCLIMSEKDIILTANRERFILNAGIHFIPNTHLYHSLNCEYNEKHQIYNNAIITDNDYCNGIKYVGKYAVVYKNISNVSNPNKCMITYEYMIHSCDKIVSNNFEFYKKLYDNYYYRAPTHNIIFSTNINETITMDEIIRQETRCANALMIMIGNQYIEFD